MQIVCKWVNLHTNKAHMEKQFHLSFYLDTRRKKENGKYPVRLRLFTPSPRTQKLYSTAFEFTEADFKSIWETVRTRAEHKATKRKMQAALDKAEDIANGLNPFSVEGFERKLLQKAGDSQNVFWYYAKEVAELEKANQISTASTYDLAVKSFKAFIENEKGKAPTALNFKEVTAKWLNRYESYMVDTMQKSSTTVSIYTRTLRTIFNKAIKAKDIDAALYPFGSDAYQPPAVKRVKKALSGEELSKLYHATPNTPEQEKAKDFWFFSYSCNGINIKDVALLKYSDLHKNSITFFRAKTKRTNRANLSEVSVHLTDFAQRVIEKYKTDSNDPKDYVFPIINTTDSEKEKHVKIKNFVRAINQNLKKLAIAEGISGHISTYWARHSFATNAIRKGGSMELVSEALNHSNLKTTKGYFAGFEDETKRQLSESLMEF